MKNEGVVGVLFIEKVMYISVMDHVNMCPKGTC